MIKQIFKNKEVINLKNDLEIEKNKNKNYKKEINNLICEIEKHKTNISENTLTTETNLKIINKIIRDIDFQYDIRIINRISKNYILNSNNNYNPNRKVIGFIIKIFKDNKLFKVLDSEKHSIQLIYDELLILTNNNDNNIIF